MSETPTRAEVAQLVRHAGLDHLPEACFTQLVDAYAHVRRMIDAIPRNRPRADEPAHVFAPEKFLPQGNLAKDQ